MCKKIHSAKNWFFWFLCRHLLDFLNKIQMPTSSKIAAQKLNEIHIANTKCDVQTMKLKLHWKLRGGGLWSSSLFDCIALASHTSRQHASWDLISIECITKEFVCIWMATCNTSATTITCALHSLRFPWHSAICVNGGTSEIELVGFMLTQWFNECH